jgi:protein O-GlcNAc transferase
MSNSSTTSDFAQGDVIRWLQQGVSFRAEGQHLAALGVYQKASSVPGAPAEVFFNLGNVLLDLGRWEESAAAMERALELQPQMTSALMQLARCKFSLGRLNEAGTHFSELVRIDPNHFSAWLEYGHLFRQLGETEKMLSAYQRAASCTPQRWEGLLALTRSLEEVGQFDLAAVNYQRAVSLAGSAASTQSTSSNPQKKSSQQGQLRMVHWRMAKYRLERGDVARAMEAMRQALMASRIENMRLPMDANEMAEMQIDLGDIQMRLGMTPEAHRAFERASTATAEAALVRLADLSFRYNLWQEAQSVLKRNVELHPESAMAHWNLAHSYAESWQMEDALEALAKAEAIEPQAGALSMRASVAGRTGDVETALRLYQSLAEAEGPLSKMRSSAAMSALYSDQLTPQAVTDLHRSMFAPLGEGRRNADSFRNTRDPRKRLRVGMVSADFHHQHPVNIFMQPVLARLDPEQFEVTVYFTGVSYDDQTQQARSRVSHWTECTRWTDIQLARRIEADGIDILLDLAGHTSLNRMTLFAQRAAPVQVSFLGYPASTGVPNMDWILTDPVVAPEGSDALYSERVYRLPNSVFCFAPEVDYPYPNYTQVHAERMLTFGSFNNVPKITQHTVALWSRVLKEVPDSQLLLKAPSFKDEGAIRTFKSRFAAQGIAEDRLIFRGPVGLSDMMAEYADVDIALDPVPYNGGTTTLQAMWMGVPVVVKAGGNFVSRMGASFMTAAGLSNWVASDDDDYVAIAKRMASNRSELLNLKQGLRARLLSRPAWGIDQYVRDFEAALRSMWTDMCQGDGRSRSTTHNKIL